MITHQKFVMMIYLKQPKSLLSEYLIFSLQTLALKNLFYKIQFLLQYNLKLYINWHHK